MPSLAELKSLLHTQLHSRRETVACSLLSRDENDTSLGEVNFTARGSAITRGTITSISGVGKTEFVLRFLAEHPDLTVAWIEETFSIFPAGFTQHRAGLERILFVDAGDNFFWSVLEALRSQVFGLVVFYGETEDLSILRRIQLATERANCLTFWLAPEMPSLWPVSLQIGVKRSEAGALAASIL